MRAIQELYTARVEKAIAYMEANLDGQLTIKDVAEQAFLSEFHFHRIFKAVTGETVKSFLMRIKIERAASLLIHSKTDIGDIAMKHGYENHESFTRAFKKYFNVSPQTYREQSILLKANKLTEYQSESTDLLELNISEPIIKHLSDLHLVYVRHIGSYDKVAASFQKLMLWSLTHLVLKLKPTTLGILHDHPDVTEESNIRFDACVLVNKEVKTQGDIAYKKITGGKYAVFRYKGKYENFYKVYDYVYHICLDQNGWELGDQPAIEWYVKSPPFYKPEQFITDFYVPIK